MRGSIATASGVGSENDSPTIATDDPEPPVTNPTLRSASTTGPSASTTTANVPAPFPIAMSTRRPAGIDRFCALVPAGPIVVTRTALVTPRGLTMAARVAAPGWNAPSTAAQCGAGTAPGSDACSCTPPRVVVQMVSVTRGDPTSTWNSYPAAPAAPWSGIARKRPASGGSDGGKPPTETCAFALISRASMPASSLPMTVTPTLDSVPLCPATATSSFDGIWPGRSSAPLAVQTRASATTRPTFA